MLQIQEKTKDAVAAANSALLEEKSRFQLQVSSEDRIKRILLAIFLRNCVNGYFCSSGSRVLRPTLIWKCRKS